MKAQPLTLTDALSPKLGPVVLQRGIVPVELPCPPPKRQRRGASWDEVRVALANKQHDIDDDGVLRARLLDLFNQVRSCRLTRRSWASESLQTLRGGVTLHLSLAQKLFG